MDDGGLVRPGAGMRRLGRGLILYGVIGIIVAAIGFGAMVWVNGRISAVRTQAESTVAGLANTMQLAAIVLRDAATTAQSFSVTVEQTALAVASASVTTTEVRSDLAAVEAQLRAVSFLGTTPLASSADAVGRIATSMVGLDTRLSLIADGLRGNQAALATDATSIGRLADSAAAFAARLGPSVGKESLGDVQQVIAITLLMFAAWSFVPALAALVLGLWLAREARPSPQGSS